MKVQAVSFYGFSLNKDGVLFWMASLMGSEMLNMETKTLLAGLSQYRSDDLWVHMRPQDTASLARELGVEADLLLHKIRLSTASGWISPIEHTGHDIRFRLRVPRS